MSTRSRIGIKNADGTIRSIYCHIDGYLNWNGMKLFKFYDTEAKVNALIDLGDISSLEENLAPAVGQKHNGFVYAERAPKTTIAYSRDRGEKNCEAKLHASEAEFIDEEYAYLWDDGAWYVWQMHEEPPVKTRLVEALVIEKLES